MNRLNRLAINEEGFVFDPSTGESFSVNKSGLYILNALKENTSTEQIARELKEQFDMTPEEVERDVIDFIDHLRSFRLV